MRAARVFSTNTFTNPHGDRVSQAFQGGMPITREFPAGDDRPTVAARAAYDAHDGRARLETWSAEEGSHVVAEKPTPPPRRAAKADVMNAESDDREPTDDEIYNRVGVEGGIGYDASDEPGSLGSSDWRL